MIIDRQDFNPLIGEAHHTCLLPPEQIKEINSQYHIRDMHIVGVQWCSRIKVVKFLMGNFATISVSHEAFPIDDSGPSPMFEHPRIDDWGFDVFLGEYKVDIRTVLALR